MNKMRKGNKLSFFKRIRVKYKLSVLNEGTLEEVYHFRLSALSFFVLSMVILLLAMALFSLLIWVTPLRKLLPENVDMTLRKEVVEDAMKIDSLTREVEMRQVYLNTIKEVVMGNIPIDTTITSDSLMAQQREEVLMEKTAEEKEFCKNFEDEERYNLTTTTNATTDMVFFRPVNGIITGKFTPVQNHFGIDISTQPNATISAVYQGVVLTSSYDPQEGYFIQILHKQNFISVYKGASMVFKKTGDVVNTGEVIAIVGHGDKKDKPSLHFELWSGMQPQDPSNYIVLE